jgi:protein CpxP
MTAQRLKVLIATTAIVVAGMAVAVAQGPMHHRGFGPDHILHFLTDQLDLTEAQQAQVKDIFAKEKPTLGPLMMQSGRIHEQLMQEAISGTFDEAKVRTLASQQGQVETAMAVEHAKIASQIFNLLTPEQKTKAQQLLQKHQQRMQEHKQHLNDGQAPPPQE